jgi:hypothetical protein
MLLKISKMRCIFSCFVKKSIYSSKCWLLFKWCAFTYGMVRYYYFHRNHISKYNIFKESRHKYSFRLYLRVCIATRLIISLKNTILLSFRKNADEWVKWTVTSPYLIRSSTGSVYRYVISICRYLKINIIYFHSNV